MYTLLSKCSMDQLKLCRPIHTIAQDVGSVIREAEWFNLSGITASTLRKTFASHSALLAGADTDELSLLRTSTHNQDRTFTTKPAMLQMRLTVTDIVHH